MFNENVIQASRDFVCIRLATYEDEEEAEFLRTIFVGRTGELDNTVFALLSPDTKRNLCRPGRGPHFAFRTPSELVAGMSKIALEFAPQERPANTVVKLPQLKNVRLGLNVSACDGLASVICVARDEEQAVTMREKLGPLAFSDELVGRFVYSTTTQASELASIDKPEGGPGFLIVRPGEFGFSGELIRRLDADCDVETLRSAMLEYVNSATRIEKNHHSHVRKGLEKGRFWQTEIPVTDPDSLRAMQRMKPKRQGLR